MSNINDPRLQELKRLRHALEAARQHLEELDAHLLKYRPTTQGLRPLANPECNFARYVAAGLEKVRQKPESGFSAEMALQDSGPSVLCLRAADAETGGATSQAALIGCQTGYKLKE